MGRTWSYDSPWDLYAMSMFNTIVNVSESPLVPGLLYVGTDDGLIQISEDGGKTFKRFPGQQTHSDKHAIAFFLHFPVIAPEACFYMGNGNTQL